MEEFDDAYWAVFRDHEQAVRDALVGGRRHVFEAEMKERRRTHGHPAHSSRALGAVTIRRPASIVVGTWARRTTPTRPAALRRPRGLRASSTTATSARCWGSSSAAPANPEVAADLTAETFAAALVARSRYRPQTANAAAWLFAIAHHKLTDYRRRGRAEDRMRARLGMESVPVGAEDAELIRWLGEEVATQLVEELPEDQREAVRAHVLEDRGYAEIAADEQLTEATVRKRVSRGLRVLRDRVGGNL